MVATADGEADYVTMGFKDYIEISNFLWPLPEFIGFDISSLYFRFQMHFSLLFVSNSFRFVFLFSIFHSIRSRSQTKIIRFWFFYWFLFSIYFFIFCLFFFFMFTLCWRRSFFLFLSLFVHNETNVKTSVWVNTCGIRQSQWKLYKNSDKRAWCQRFAAGVPAKTLFWNDERGDSSAFQFFAG